MDEPEHTDVVVIGMGPGGEYAAGTLARPGCMSRGSSSAWWAGNAPTSGAFRPK